MERVSFHRLAHREVSEAGEFYELESPGLGVAFLDEVECCTQAILQYPEAGQLIVGKYAGDFSDVSRMPFCIPSNPITFAFLP